MKTLNRNINNKIKICIKIFIFPKKYLPNLLFITETLIFLHFFRKKEREERWETYKCNITKI